MYEKIQSGELAQRRARRLTLIRTYTEAFLLLILSCFLIYDYNARVDFVWTTKQVFAEGLIEKGKYGEVARRIKDVKDRYSWSTIRFLEVPEFLKALEDGSLAVRKKARASRSKK
jgi:hypothetical protein